MKKLETYIKKGKFYEAVVEDGSDIIFLVAFDGEILYNNSSVYQILGYRSKSLIGKNFFDYILPSTQEEFIANFKKSQKRAYTEKVEFQFLCKDKTFRFLEFNAINLKNKEGLQGLILDCRDITQRKKDAEELLRLQKAKEQFLANISHEIRTPINGISGIAGLLSENQNSDERETYLNAIKHSAENLKIIINDILDLASIDSGKLKFENIPFNLTNLLPSLISTFSYQAKEKNLILNYKIDKELNTVLLGDPARLNQILINLIGNAVKFTSTGSIIVAGKIAKEQKNNCWVQISVKDSGVGIPTEKLSTIFESFSQADESVTRRYGGTGLGLTIAKQLVELQKGKIVVESKEHVGSIFTVTIPYKYHKQSKISKLTFHHKDSEGKSVLPNLRVLLVEDNDINRLYAKSILETWKCKVEIAENGLIAVEKLKSELFDIILMDIQMPIMDGYEATRIIRAMKSSQSSNIPIIALTANASKIDAEKCLAAGMTDYLSKPFTPEDLYQKLFKKFKGGITNGTGTDQTISFDLTYLKKISNGNVEFIREMVQTFIQSIPVSLQDMEEALKESNSTKLAKIAHQIKPSLTLLGSNQLKELAVRIEALAKPGVPSNTDNINQMVNDFLKEGRKVIAGLSKISKTL